MLGVENRTSAHAQDQHDCCTNLAKRLQHHATSQMLHKILTIFKFEPTTPNMSQHVATHRNRVAKRTQHVASNNVGICCGVEMLRPFSRGFSFSFVTGPFKVETAYPLGIRDWVKQTYSESIS